MKMTFEEFLIKSSKGGTAKSYLREVNYYLQENPKAKKYGYKEVQDHVGRLRERYDNHNTISRILSSIKKWYDYLVYTGQRDDHPAKNLFVKGKRGRDVPHEALFSPAELELLMNREERFPDVALRNKVVFSLLIYQGLTLLELCRIKLNDIDFDKGTVHIKTTNKTANRILELKPMQIKLIMDYINNSRKKLLERRLKKSDSLIINMRGDADTQDGINYLVQTMKGLFPDKNLHAKYIRMSVIANKLNVDKLPLNIVQDFAGQKYASTTIKYRKPDEDKNRELINMYHPLNRKI